MLWIAKLMKCVMGINMTLFEVCYRGEHLHTFADKQNALRYVSVAYPNSNTVRINEKKTSDDDIDLLTKQYVVAIIRWGCFQELNVSLFSRENIPIYPLFYYKVGDYHSIILCREYRGEDYDLLKTSYGAIMPMYANKVDKMIANGMSSKQINDELIKERGGY